MMNIIYNIYNLIINKIHNLIENKFYDDDKFINHWNGSNLVNNYDNYLLSRVISRTDTGSSEYKLIIRVLENNMSKHIYMRNTTDTYIFKIKDNFIKLVNIDLSDNTSLVFKLSRKLKTELIREIKLLATRKLISVSTNETISNENKKSTFKSISSLPILGDDINQYSILYDELPDDSHITKLVPNDYNIGFSSGLSLTPTAEYNARLNNEVMKVTSDYRFETKRHTTELKGVPVYIGVNESFDKLIEIFQTALDGAYSSYRKDETFKSKSGYDLSRRVMFEMTGAKYNKGYDTYDIKYIQFEIDPNLIRIKTHSKYNITTLDTTIKFGMSSIVLGTKPPAEIGLIIPEILRNNNIELSRGLKLIGTLSPSMYYATASSGYEPEPNERQLPLV